MGGEREKKKDNPQVGEKSKKLSDKQKADMANVFISFLDSQVATWLRRKVAPRAPEWMRSPTARQWAGPFRALMEAITGDKHWLIKVFGEKVGSDYPDMFFTILGGEPEKAAGGTEKTTSRFDDFIRHADKRLLEAEDPAAEWERLKKQFRLQQELEAFVEEARKAQEEREPKTEEPERQPVDWSGRRKKLRQKTRRRTKRWADRLGEVADQLEQEGG